MKFKTPQFWYNEKKSLAWFLLLPLSLLYAILHLIDQRIKQVKYKSDIPVICIGNLNAGGSGKTPVAIAICKLIKKYKLANNPIFLSRGYGGDETKILEQHAPVIINKNRIAGAKEAENKKADLIIMDDGFQNPSLYKDISFIVIDGMMGFGNKFLLPAGPLRTPLKSGLKKADAFIFIGEDERDIIPTLPLTLFRSKFTSTKTVSPDKKYLAFAGLGYPEKFFSYLKKDLRLNIVSGISFPDHHPYTNDDLKDLKERAASLGAELITTEKDAVKFTNDHKDINVLPVALKWDDEKALAEFLEKSLPSRS